MDAIIGAPSRELDVSLKGLHTNEVIDKSSVTLRLEQGGKPVKVSGIPKFPTKKGIAFDSFAAVRGGELFFVPSIPVLTAWGNK
jgi:hypothetical protein